MNNQLSGKPNKKPPIPPKTSPVHEESIQGMSSEKEVCKICRKTFKIHTQLDRHMEREHGNPEKTHTKPHAVE